MNKQLEKYAGLRLWLQSLKPVTTADNEYTQNQQAIIDLYDEVALLEDVAEAAEELRKKLWSHAIVDEELQDALAKLEDK